MRSDYVQRPGRNRCVPIAPIVLLLSLALAPVAKGQAVTPEPELPPPDTLKKMSVEQLLDMVVTSVSKRPEKLLDTASAIQVITSDDIDRSGATSIPEALRLASNLEVAQIDSRQWAISSRGFDNVFADKMLVLIDGRSVYTPLYGGVYWDVQDTMMEDLDRIEVISGPGATQWGANAVNGVINITTKSAKDTQGGLLVSEVGSQVDDSTEVRYGGEMGGSGVYYRVYAKYTERGDSLQPDGDDADDNWRMGQTGFRMDWEAAGGNTLTLQGDAYNATMGQTGADDITANGGNVLARWSKVFENNSDFKLQVYYDRTHRNIPGSFDQDLGTYDFDFQYHLPLGTINDIVTGVGYRLVEDDIVNTPAEAFLPPDTATHWLNAFVQDDVALIKDHLHLIAGTKVEHNDYTGFEVEPSGRIAWTPDDKQTVWTAVSRAVRTPSRIDVDLYSPATPPYRIAGGPNVVSEKLLAYELGYRAQVAPTLALSIATYYNDYRDLRSLEPLDPPRPFPVEISSGLEGRSVGAELTADWQPSKRWRLRAGYTDMRVHSEPEGSDRSSDRSTAHDPNQQFSLRSMWDIATHWDLDADMRYVGPISNQAVPGYTEMDLHLAWHPTVAWDFSITGQNLLHNQHAEFNSTGSRREIPRSVYGKTAWHF